MIKFIISLFKKCDHEFSGLYNVRASNKTVEMKCTKCGKLKVWTFEEFEKIEKENQRQLLFSVKELYICTSNIAIQNNNSFIMSYNEGLYPTKIGSEFEREFDRLIDAKDFAKTVNVKGDIQRIAPKHYKVEYYGFYSNKSTTGRKYHVIDEMGNLHFEVVTTTTNIKDKSLRLIDGFNGEFKIVGGLEADILCSVKLLDDKFTQQLISEITENEKLKYKEMRELEKQTARGMFVESLTKTKNK